VVIGGSVALGAGDLLLGPLRRELANDARIEISPATVSTSALSDLGLTRHSPARRRSSCAPIWCRSGALQTWPRVRAGAQSRRSGSATAEGPTRKESRRLLATLASPSPLNEPAASRM
jgi:hypothetical protein